MNPFANHRDLYLLVAGLIVGVLLSPAVLGRIAPQSYEAIFFGNAAELRQQLEDFDAETTRKLETLSDPALGESIAEVAIREMLTERRLEKNKLEAQLAQAENQTPAALYAIIFAVLAVMVAETLVSPSVEQRERAAISPAVARLVRVRYGLLAIWLAIIVARNDLLAHLPIVFLVLLLVLAGVVGFVPLSKRPAS